jgi:Prenyltransferase and squalene oxidase repeat
MIDSLHTYQNSDGGWPYRPGSSSWTEPTVFALLAGYARGDSTGRERALAWLRALQRVDGGWSPKPGVDQSTWVTALAALLPPGDLGAAAHSRAVRWLLGSTSINSSYLFRLRSWLNGNTTGDPNEGWPWLPGTAAWATPTAIAILALAKENRRNPDPALERRIASARRFLLAHRCEDGGWNHGSMKALGIDAPSYPETTGTALLAFAGPTAGSFNDAPIIASAVARAEAWWSDRPSCEATSWLMLGLRATGHGKAAFPAGLKARTIQDAALRIIAAAGDRGTEIFLA